MLLFVCVGAGFGLCVGVDEGDVVVGSELGTVVDVIGVRGVSVDGVGEVVGVDACSCLVSEVAEHAEDHDGDEEGEYVEDYGCGEDSVAVGV